MTPRPGDFFEQYYLMAPLGEGGMSHVFLAFDFVDIQLVALKLLRPDHHANPGIVARMRREGEIYQRLDHPAIVGVHQVGGAPGVPVFLALEYLRGRPLDQIMVCADGPLAVPFGVRVLEDTASALNLAHRREVFHRDVKPHNIVVNHDSRSTLVDFGIAEAEDEHGEAIGDGMCGTWVYAAPEQRRDLEPDHRADVFSLGAVVYELLTGQPAVQGNSRIEIALASSAGLSPPSRINPAVPRQLDAMCMKMLADNPEDRYQSLRELLIELGLLRIRLPEEERVAMFGTKEERDADDASKALREGDYTRALELSEDLAGALPPGAPATLRAEADHLVARARAMTGRPGEALEAFRSARLADPDSVDLLSDQALLLLRMGRFEEASDAILSSPMETREHLLPSSLAELIRAIPEVPPELLARFSFQGAGRSFQRAARDRLETRGV